MIDAINQFWHHLRLLSISGAISCLLLPRVFENHDGHMLIVSTSAIIVLKF